MTEFEKAFLEEIRRIRQAVQTIAGDTSAISEQLAAIADRDNTKEAGEIADAIRALANTVEGWTPA